MLITELLELDHAKFRRLLEVLEEAAAHNRESSLVGLRDTLREITALESAHEAVEEELLLPALRKAPGIEPALLERFKAAHREIKRRISDVEACCRERWPMSTTRRAVEEYAKACRDHMRGEEAALFGEVDKALSKEVSESLAGAAAARAAQASATKT